MLVGVISLHVDDSFGFREGMFLRSEETAIESFKHNPLQTLGLEPARFN